MENNEKPLFNLTVKEFISLTKRVVDDALQEREQAANDESLPSTNEKQHLTIKELSEFLRSSIVSIHNYKKRGMPYYKVGRKVLFQKQEVLAFMKSINLKTNKKRKE